MKRTFMMLAHQIKKSKFDPVGQMISEKWDGFRAWYDGGISRGLPISQVPWANINKKDSLLVEPIATGLWSRYGNVIHAPYWWINNLPLMSLDMEITHREYGRFQEIRSICSRHDANGDWSTVVARIIDLPPLPVILAPGEINEPNFKVTLDNNVLPWALIGQPISVHVEPFYRQYERLCRVIGSGDMNLRVVEQRQIPTNSQDAETAISCFYQEVLDRGGEGVIMRRRSSFWEPCRSHDMVKSKPAEDAEGTVVGYITGRATDKGSRLLGKLGALILEHEGPKGVVRLELSGFTDEERCLLGRNAVQWAVDHPGVECPSWISAYHFPLGSTVTFKYREYSDDGIPKEARFFRT